MWLSESGRLHDGDHETARGPFQLLSAVGSSSIRAGIFATPSGGDQKSVAAVGM